MRVFDTLFVAALAAGVTAWEFKSHHPAEYETGWPDHFEGHDFLPRDDAAKHHHHKHPHKHDDHHNGAKHEHDHHHHKEGKHDHEHHHKGEKHDHDHHHKVPAHKKEHPHGHPNAWEPPHGFDGFPGDGFPEHGWRRSVPEEYKKLQYEKAWEKELAKNHHHARGEPLALVSTHIGTPVESGRPLHEHPPQHSTMKEHPHQPHPTHVGTPVTEPPYPEHPSQYGGDKYPAGFWGNQEWRRHEPYPSFSEEEFGTYQHDPVPMRHHNAEAGWGHEEFKRREPTEWSGKPETFDPKDYKNEDWRPTWLKKILGGGKQEQTQPVTMNHEHILEGSHHLPLARDVEHEFDPERMPGSDFGFEFPDQFDHERAPNFDFGNGGDKEHEDGEPEGKHQW